MPRYYRRVSREDHLIFHLFYIVVALLAQQLEGQEARVPLVEVEGRDVAVAHVAEQAQPADA